MNLGSEPADQVVRYTLEGTEVALKLSGLAAKNFALFVYAVLKDQKKTRGKTRLVRMLKEQRPFKFFQIPRDTLREFAKEARTHGLLYVPIRNKQNHDQVELVVFADDAAKVQRVLDNLNLDFVKAQAGEAVVESPTQGAPGNFTQAREEKSPSGNFSPSKSDLPGSGESRPSVRKELREIRRDLHEKPTVKAPIPHRAKGKTKDR